MKPMVLVYYQYFGYSWPAPAYNSLVSFIVISEDTRINYDFSRSIPVMLNRGL